MKPLRVGLIGASPGNGWALRAHLPALARLEAVKLMAVATSHQETADATAARYDVPLAFGSVDEMLGRDDIDLVSVVVRVPNHAELVHRALAAGKHIYCEWPLGVSLIEATDLLHLADAGGRVHVVGLQSRRSPVLRYIRALIAEGFVGRVLSCDVVSNSPDRGTLTVAGRDAWKLDRRSGQNILTIKVGHIADALQFCLDASIVEVEAMIRTQTPQALIAGTDERVRVTAPDQVLISAALDNDSAMRIHVQAGAGRSPHFRMEIHGDRGYLTASGDDGVQTSDLTLRGASRARGERALRIPQRYVDPGTEDLRNPAGNVARAYLAFADGIREHRPIEPTFRDAVAMHRLIAAIELAADRGERQSV